MNFRQLLEEARGRITTLFVKKLKMETWIVFQKVSELKRKFQPQINMLNDANRELVLYLIFKKIKKKEHAEILYSGDVNIQGTLYLFTGI